MSKITLTDVKGGFNLTAIQSNFDALETELQGKVLYRNNPVGEPNTLETDLDMNNKRILNLPAPIGDNEPLRKGDAGSLSSLIASAAGYASTASIKADEAEASALSAAASASSADADAIAAAASAVAADASADAAAASAIAAEASSRLDVGTTTTGAPGSSVIVAISGAPGTQLLSLTIPRGDVGATGATGPTGPTGGVASVNSRTGAVTGVQDTAEKDTSGGYAGLTLFKLNLRNAANTITSWFTNAATVARTWTLPDKDGTVAMTSDITGGTSAGSFTTLTASGAATFPAGATVTGAVLLGYGTGSGGTVTQATSKSTAVTLNKPGGKITLNNAALAAGSTVLFTFSNTLIGSTDMVDVQLDASGISSTADYNVWASAGTGAAVFALKNVSAGSLSEAVGLRFAVKKVAQS